MAEQMLSVERREDKGKGKVGRLRRSGKIPGVLYGDGKEPVPLTADAKGVEGIMTSASGVNTIFDLEMVGTKQRRPAMIHEYQRHPVEGNITHIDFIRVNMERKLHVKVHVRVEGVPNGVKNQGGILEFLHREINLECLPADIPHEIVIDASPLNVGQSIRVHDLKLDPAKFRILDDAETVIVVVALPAAEAAAAATVETEAAAEPEVIKKGKEKEGEEKGAEAKGKEAKPAAAKPAAGKDKK